MKSKKCSKCGEVKTVDCFSKDKGKKDGLMSNCKECIKKYRQENKNEILKKRKKRYQKNKQKALEWQKKHYQENRKKTLERVKKYYQKNKKKRREYIKNRYNTDPLFKLKENVRRSIRTYLKNGKSKRTSEILGCIYEQLLLNLGHPPEDAHLDHIVPQGLAESEEEIYTLNHWSNFQWLPAQENMSKSSNFTYKHNLDHVLKNHPEPDKIRAITRRAQKDGYQIVKSDKRQSKESILAGLY